MSEFLPQAAIAIVTALLCSAMTALVAYGMGYSKGHNKGREGAKGLMQDRINAEARASRLERTLNRQIRHEEREVLRWKSELRREAERAERDVELERTRCWDIACGEYHYWSSGDGSDGNGFGVACGGSGAASNIAMAILGMVEPKPVKESMSFSLTEPAGDDDGDRPERQEEVEGVVEGESGDGVPDAADHGE